MGNHTDPNKRLSLDEAGDNAFAALSATTAHDVPIIGEQYICHLKYKLYLKTNTTVSLTVDSDINARSPNDSIPSWLSATSPQDPFGP